MNRDPKRIGIIYLVGAGPGHPGLLTSRAKSVLEQADVVVYDRLLSPRLLSFAPKTARFIYVGKGPSHHAMAQGDINALLVDLGRAGKRVVRLKGGDPFVFGRGGEEAAACRDAGIAFEVVPGVTSPVAVSAYAGIPVTHRGVATSFTVVTGHLAEADGSAHADGLLGSPTDGGPAKMGQRVAGGLQADRQQDTGTLIVLMGMQNLERWVRHVLDEGRRSSTPVAVVRWGTRASQQTVTGDLSSIVDKVREAKLQSPAIVVVGDVVHLRDTLQWVEERPLFGRRVLVAADTIRQGRSMAEAMEELGAEVVDVAVEQGTFANPLHVQQLLKQPVGAGAELVFRHVATVHAFFDGLSNVDGRTIDARSLAQYRFIAATPEVAEALRAHGIWADGMLENDAGGAVDTLTDVEAPTRTDGMAEGDLWLRCRQAGTASGSGVVQTVQLCTTDANTEQLQAMFEACDEDFDLCWATSEEAVQFAEAVRDRHQPCLELGPVRRAATAEAAATEMAWAQSSAQPLSVR